MTLETTPTILETVRYHLNKLLGASEDDIWPKEVTFDESFPYAKARIYKNGEIEVTFRQPLTWVDLKFTIDIEKAEK